jgi:hypothetical protein
VAFTQQDLEAVEHAIARGERVVQFADRSVTYRSIQELQIAQEMISAQLNQATRKKQFLGVGNKGY